jgi:uncharacterized phosphosugar-binding protein
MGFKAFGYENIKHTIWRLIMSANVYFQEVGSLLQRVSGQEEAIKRAAAKCAEAIQKGNWVRMFGSGHSVIPVMDCFPRYGGYPGWYPIMDPRLMWTTVSGFGGAEELLWLERQEGYADVFLRHNEWNKDDVLIVISHGGQNAAPVEVAQAAKRDGLFVIALTSMENHTNRAASHSSGQKIGDVADLILDNCVSPEDAVVPIPGVLGNVAGTSTLSAIILIQALVAQTAMELSDHGYIVKPFASPNVLGIKPNHNEEVYVDFRSRVRGKSSAETEAVHNPK